MFSKQLLSLVCPVGNYVTDTALFWVLYDRLSENDDILLLEHIYMKGDTKNECKQVHVN